MNLVDKDALTALWWIRLPRKASRMSRGLAFALADGHFLATYPLLGLLITPASVITGLVCGVNTLGYARSFTESLVVMSLAVSFGFLAGQSGLAFVSGFAVGDFFLGQTKWTFYSLTHNGIFYDGFLAGLLRVRLPMLIAYLLMAALAVGIPVLIRRLLYELPGAHRLPAWLGFGIGGLLNVMLVYVGVTLWAAGAAVMIRPMFTWSANSRVWGVDLPSEQAVPVRAIQPLQMDAAVIARIAVIAVLVRLGLLALAWFVHPLASRMRAIEHGLAEPIAEVDRPGRVHTLVLATLLAGLSTLIFAGMITFWWVAVLFFAEFLLLRLLVAGLIPPRIDWWRTVAAKVPLLVRLAFALVIVRTLSDAFVNPAAATFTPVALFVAATVAVLYLLIPGSPRQQVAT